MPASSYTIPNLIQGVSQQAPEQRRPSQCEAQQNCYNSVREGVVARQGLEWMANILGTVWTDAFFYEIFRNFTERYIVIIGDVVSPAAGQIRVWDWNNRIECVVTKDGSEGTYLAGAAGGLKAKDNFRAQTVDDFTFILNRTVPIGLTTATQPQRPPEGLIFVKAGNYLQMYQISIYYDDGAGLKSYIWSYITPDNSVAANGPYINSASIAATFFKAMTGGNAAILTSGGGIADDSLGVGPLFTGDVPAGRGTVSATITASSLGFDVELRGNVLRVWRAVVMDVRSSAVTMTIASPGVISWAAHGFSGHCPQPVSFSTTGALPTGVTAGTTYFTVPASIVGNPDSFEIATTRANALAGTAINTSGSQSGVHTGTVVVDGFDEFSLDAGDGVGNTFMIAVKDTVQSLNDLPLKAFHGFRVQVGAAPLTGSSPSSFNGYYVEYTDQDVWEETVGGGVHTTLDEDTMPHALINTGFQTFTFQKVGTWSTRVAGDDLSAPLPYFVGKACQDIFYFAGRLGLLTDAAIDMGKSKNPYTWFPDTVQTTLGTAPIDTPVNGSKSISLLRRAVTVAEGLFLWAQSAQWRVSSDNQPFRPETVNTRQSTAFYFAEAVAPQVLGSTLYYIFEPDNFATMLAVPYTLSYLGTFAGTALDVTLHVPAFVPAGCRQIAISPASGMTFVRTEGGDLSQLYVYSSIVQGGEVVQSAWQTWKLPECNVLWCGCFGAELDLIVQREEGIIFGRIPLNNVPVDLAADGTQLAPNYTTRLDFRLPESSCGVFTYDAPSDTTSFTYAFEVRDLPNLRVVIRATSARRVRGEVIPIVIGGHGITTAGTRVVVQGNITEEAFYVGVRVDSFLTMSQFFPRDPAGAAVFYDDIIMKRLLISHYNTGYYAVEVSQEDNTTQTTEWTSRQQVGDKGETGTGTGALVPTQGKLDVPIELRSENCFITLRNDSPYPSAWQRARITYAAVNRGQRDPSQ